MPTPDFTTFPIPTLLLEQGGVTATGSTTIRTLADRFRDYGVNVKDFGAVGDGTADDTAAIQAAIDYAYNQNIQTIRLPRGNYKTTSPLYLDPPGNLRSNLANPPAANFSLALVGDSVGNGELDGVRISPTFKNTVVLYVGPGQGMRVADFSIVCPSDGLWRAQQNSAGIGVGICGTGGGAYRVQVSNIWVQNIYTAYKTGANGNGSLDDSNIFTNCLCTNCQIGFWVSQAQNFTNMFYNCNPNANVGLFTPVGAGGHVYGGNWSAGNGQANAFTIGSYLNFAATGIGNYFDYTFTAIITAPDAYVGTEVYNSYALKTAHFGVVPLTMTAWNSGTNTGTFKVLTSWSEFHYFQVNALTATDLQAEIQVCTTLYAAERVTMFWGTGITVRGGVHIENAFAPTTLILSGQAFGSAPPSVLGDLMINVDPSLADLAGNSGGSLAKYYIQQSFPFIWLANNNQVTIEKSHLQMTSGHSCIIQFDNQTARLVMRENVRAGPFVSQVSRTGNLYTTNSAQLGGGELYGRYMFAKASNQNQYPGEVWRDVIYLGQSPFYGMRPAPWSRPAIHQSNVATLAGTLPAISYSGGNLTQTYPLLWGGQRYGVTDIPGVTNIQNYEVYSNHSYYTFGQDITTSVIAGLAWNYKGQSHVVNADAGTLDVLFPGMGIKLFDGSSDVLYVVNGVFPGLGYFTVFGSLSGLKTAVINGTVIKQEPFALASASGPANAVTKTTDFTVAPLEDSIIVNKGSTCTVTLPSASTYNGRSIKIKTIQAFTVVSASANVIPLTGGAATTAILAATAGKWAELTANGSNWEIVQSN